MFDILEDHVDLGGHCLHELPNCMAGVHDMFHDLRHTQASLMLYAGVDLKVIQQRLGHSSFATTANLYAHLMTDSQAQAAEKLSSLLKREEPQ